MNDARNSKSKIRIGKDLFISCFVLVLITAVGAGNIEQSMAQVNANPGVEAMDTEAAGAEAMDAEAMGAEAMDAEAMVAEAGGSEEAADIVVSGLPAAEENVSAGAKIQSITFKKDMRIQDALQFLAARYKRNIVPSSKVDGMITVTNLYDVTFDEALNGILGYGFKYEQEGNFIKVYTAEEYKMIKDDEERMVYEVFTLYYISADDALKLVTPVLSKKAIVQASTAAETEISGGSGSGAAGGASIGTASGGDSLALNDTIVVYDYPENIKEAAKVLKSLDIRPKQVLVEATILSVLLTEGMEFGVDLNLLAGISLDGTAAGAGTADAVLGGYIEGSQTAGLTPMGQVAAGVPGAPMETYGFTNTTGGGLRIGFRHGDVTAIITALETVTDTTVLANPKILAVNKQEGSVLIGTNLGYRSSTSISTGGVATEGEVKFLQTGTQLVFRPYIGNDGYIRMDIYPKDSSAALNADGVPTENTTQLKSNIIVKDGGTVVIGGLFRDVITTSRSQVPLLGDIPIIGGLFRKTNDSVRREEVIVLLTTHIIEEPSEVDGEARADDIRRKRFGAKDELQEIGRAKRAENSYAKAAKAYLEGDNDSAMHDLGVTLRLRPSYLEALRLKERIIAETSPDEVEKLERIMLEAIDEQEAPKWMRR